MLPSAGSSRSERVAVLVAGLVWLALLTYPALALTVGTPPGPTILPAVAALAALLVAYIRAVLLIARDGPPQLRPVELGVVAVLAGVLPLAFGSGWFGATVFVAALAGLSWSAPRALLGVAAATVLAVVTGLPSGAPGPQLVSVPLVTVLAGVVMVVVARQVALARELARVTAEAERLRLARELHDSVKQHVFIAAMELGTARAHAGGDEHLDNAAEAIAQAQRELTGVLDELRSADSELAPALRRFARQWSRRTGVALELSIHDADGMAAEPLLPVAVEALTNVERHAAASTVRVCLRADGLTVRDDGAGFDPATAGHGLRGMRERIAAGGGTLDVRSGPSGTTVLARCPR